MKALMIAGMVLFLAPSIALAKGKEKVEAAAKADDSTPAIEILDADKDGRLSKDEVKTDTALTGKFDSLDLDKDGFLVAKELKTKPSK